MGCTHFAGLIFEQARKFGTRTALKVRNNESGKWSKISWNTFGEKVMLTAKAMAEVGVKEQQNIGVYSQNMPEYIYTDFAAFANRAVAVPMYATNSPSQIDYIIRDAQIEVLFVGEQQQYNNAFKVQQDCPVLKKIIVFDPSVKINPADKTSQLFEEFLRFGDHAKAEATVMARTKQATAEDLATIIYTSGTTGVPKGVMLHHSAYLEAMRIHNERLYMLSDKDTTMSFLPFSHIYEKAWAYFCCNKGITIAINLDPKMIQQTLPEVRPTVMCNVPRFWEKVYTGLQEKIRTSSPFMQKLFKKAIATGESYLLDHINKGKKPSLKLKLQFQFYDRLIFSRIRKILGIDRAKIFPVASAPLADHVNKFLQSLGIPLRYGYGLTETTATVCFFPETHFELGSVGTLMPGIELKIDPANNEILVKGKTVTAGYYNKPKENQESFTEDGFFRTGDAGRLENNVVYFSERIKDLFKTSNGKYIAPQALESLLGSDRFIDQIAAIGDERKFASALIVPDRPALETYARENGISYDNYETLATSEQIKRLLEARIETLQVDLASYEKVKKITILPTPFMMGDELTDTLKLRRPIIYKKYAKEIEAMYSE